MDQRKTIAPTILTIFGATGDLSANYLLPALYRMEQQGLLPDNFRLICIGRRDFSTKGFLNFIVKKSKNLKAGFLANRKFLKHLIYYRGNFNEPKSFTDLTKFLNDQERPQHLCYNRLYYFATSPQFFAAIAKILKNSGLLTTCQNHERKIRILVEKPFGFNLKSAQALNRLLLKYFTEEQIYRIDHYQGKETVQNLMVVRFANSLFEPLWNAKYVDRVEIAVSEKEKIGSRGSYYDMAGELKDMVQNHALQMLSLIAMDEPKVLTTELIRNEKVKILKALRPFTAKTVAGNIVRGQYKGYAQEIGNESLTETFVALKAHLNLLRWKNVPFYLRTGKALSQKLTEISIHFKELPHCLFRDSAPNVLTFRIQPDESVHLQFNNKIPGSGIRLHQADLEFGYKSAFKKELPSAYERLLLDFIQGDQRLFIRSDEIEAAWKFIDSITNNWNKKNCPLYIYKPGTSGPKEAKQLCKLG